MHPGIHFSHGGKSSLADCGFTFAGQRSRSNGPVVSLCSEKFLICFVAALLTFFIAGPLYLLCFKHVDNLDAYSIPSGDRPSHPIYLRQLT